MNGESGVEKPSKASVAIVSINGRDFVAGLFWQPLTRLRAYMAEAREIGQRESMDIVTIRRSIIMQAGFVAKNQGVAKGMYSLAASLASQLGNSWLGVFEIDPKHFALIAVHDGAIVPGCDLIGSREEIGNKLRVVYNYFTWAAIYAPASFEFGGEPLDIARLLQPANLKRENQLRPLTFGISRRELVLVGFALTLVVGGLIGYAQWVQYQDKQRREEALRAEQARLAELEKLKANTPRAGSNHPWAGAPTPQEFMRACLGAIDALHLSVGGWLLDEAKCDGKATLASYKRKETASVNDFLAAARQVYAIAPIIGADGDGGNIAFPLDVPSGGDDALAPADSATADFYSHLQALGIAIRLTEKTAQTPQQQPQLPGQLPGQNGALPPPTQPDWKTFAFNVQSDVSPAVVFAGQHPPGLRFTEIGLQLHGDEARLTWNVAGELNAK